MCIYYGVPHWYIVVTVVLSHTKHACTILNTIVQNSKLFSYAIWLKRWGNINKYIDEKERCLCFHKKIYRPLGVNALIQRALKGYFKTYLCTLTVTIHVSMELIDGFRLQEKREEIWLIPVTKTPTPTENSKKQRDSIKNATKNFDYTTIADRLRTVSRVTAVTQLVWLNQFTCAQPSQ